ncbi:hypothetical protein JKP88DRAFT_204036 [Tribonema minus]|uniref:Uncharacterized protein n=1 Tax=Tribonema minus TaxID=303371 RepID=A0A835ZF77_9STRA|nr:hypothetical protein JKP88DRAFT_208700 [Tribonema minus]KAG5192600.1 hypothetical protein JKP88DRAFT_204036 [Tribonema minus]
MELRSDGSGSSYEETPFTAALRLSGGGIGRGKSVAPPPPSAPARSSFGFASAWGVLSVLSILAGALRRLVPIALQPFKAGDLSYGHWALYMSFVALMAYVEGHKAFQKKFSPMVVQRALTLDQARTSFGPLRIILAGPYCMGLFYATRKRKIVSWTLYISVIALVTVVRQLPYPWRSIIDAGVVAGLSWGASAILYFWVRSWFGRAPGVDAQMPESKEEAPAKQPLRA